MEVVERERLHQQASEALGHLAVYHEESGEYERAARAARRQVELEPWRESAHRQWMRALALSGQRGAALAQYEACRRVMAEELGIEPEPETVALYEQIQSGRELSVGAAPPPNNLPAQLTPFVGRELLLAEIVSCLEDPACRLLTLVGPGGSGKTRLALEAAARQLDNYPDGVFFVSLAPLQSVETIVPTIGQEIGLSFSGGADPKEQLLGYLRRKNVLLVLDNYEHLLEGAGLATEILRAAPGARILATSRSGLHVQGEHRFPVFGMSYPGDAPAEGVPQTEDALQSAHCVRDALRYSAVRLFAAGARRAQPGFELTDDNVADVSRICQLVDGIPLAIVLAAAWVEMLTPSEISAEIERSLDVLEMDLRDAPERQRSMRAVFDHSWQLLSPRGQDILAGLSVFRGGFTREAAQEVAGASLRDLMSLVNRSLTHRTAAPSTTLPSSALGAGRTGGRFEIHELLRQYAAGVLDCSSEASEAAHDAHCAYYVAALDGWAAGLKGQRQQATVAEMDGEIDNAHAAWDWAVARGQAERLDQAMEGLGLYYEWRVRYEEGEAAFRAAADRLAEMEKEAVGRVRIVALTWQAFFGRHLGRDEVARQLLQWSLDLLECPEFADQDVRPEKARALQEMGWIEYWSGNNEWARQLLMRSLSLCRALGDSWMTVNALSILGQVTQNLGQYDEAKRLHQEALDIRRALGDQRGIAESLEWIATALGNQGQGQEAESLVRESAMISRDLGDPISYAERLWRLGVVLRGKGEFVESLLVLEEGLAHLSDFRSSVFLAPTHTTVGTVKTDLGRYKEARTHLQQGIALARARGQQLGIGFALFGIGSLALVEEQYADAQQYLRESIAVYQEAEALSDIGVSLAALAGATRGLGQLSEARKYLCKALQRVIDIRDVPKSMYALPVAALLLADRGEVERAVEIYALALRDPYVANSCWFEDVYGRQIAAAAEALPPEVVAAAQERGQARDLWTTVEELLAELEEKASSREDL